MEEVILVNEKDEEVGTMEKLEAHEKGVLHRAISVFVFDSKGRMLIHQRAEHKYHSGGLWTNTCCSHPRKGEATMDAASRRLQEEMGIQCELSPALEFVYKAEVGNGLIEYEYDHVFIGVCDDLPSPAPEEVASFKYISIPDLQQELTDTPEQFTYWFRHVWKDILTFLKH